MASNRAATRSAQPDESPTRLQRLLAFMFGGVIGASILCLIALIVAGAIRADITQGVWPIVLVLPVPGFTIAFLLLIALIIVTAMRRSQAAKDARG